MVLFPGALGDAVCLEPTIAHLARAGPVTLYARGPAARVATLYPAEPALRSLDAPEVARLFAPAGADHLGWLDGYARIVSFTGAGTGYVRERLERTGRATVAPFPRPPLEAHAADVFLRAATGDPLARAAPPRLVAPRARERDAIDPDAPVLALFPGSGGSAKRAPASVFVALAEEWRRRCGGEPVVVLGPAELDEAAVWRAIGRVVAGDDVRELAALLVGAAAFAGNDSGPSHVAAALCVPGIVFFTATRPQDFGPRGRGVVALALPRERHAEDEVRDIARAALRNVLP